MAVVESRDSGFEFDQQRQELIEGLTAEHRAISPKFFYDEVGSQLFNRICELPEYYPTRTEKSILTDCRDDIAACVGPVDVVVEPGAGSCEKVRLLLDALQPGRYVPIDVSADFLQQAANQLGEEYPQLDVVPVAADFSDDFSLPAASRPGKALLFYPGSTIGNFTPEQALAFLQDCARDMDSGGGLLIGVDLHKDSATLNAAYNDAEGVTAAFNRNILLHANRILHADFNPEQFEHRAFYNTDHRRIEMHLVSRVEQQVSFNGGQLKFAPGDSIHTEYSCKYSRQDFADLAAGAGFVNRGYWSDAQEWFSVQYFELT